MSKKLIALVLVLTLCLSLAACWGQGTTDPTDPTEPAEKVMEFEYFGRISSPYPESSPIYDKLMEETGVTVHFTWAAKDAYETLLSSRISDRDLPDVIGNVSYNSLIQSMIDDGLIIPLTDLMKEKMPNYYKLLTEDDIIMSKNNFDGEIYSFGFVHGVQAYTSWAIRQDWLDALNMSVPETWDQWMAAWRGIKKTDLNGNGEADEIPLLIKGSGDFVPLMNAFGIATNGRYSVVDGQYVYDAEHPRYMEFLDTVRAMFVEGLIPADYISVDSKIGANLLGANRVGSYCMSVSTTPQYGKLLAETDEDAMYVCTSPVKGPYGDQLIAQRAKLENDIWITKAAVDEGKLDAILEFFNYVFSDEGIHITNYGIEGETYEMVDGKPKLLSPYVDAFKPARSYGLVPQTFAFYFLPEVFIDISFAGMKVEDMDKYTYEAVRGNTMVNEGFYYAEPQGFSTEASIEYADLIAEQVAIRDKYIMGIITRDEYLKEYNALKNAGLSEVIKQANEAYQAVAGK